jgi:hypothetical protein
MCGPSLDDWQCKPDGALWTLSVVFVPELLHTVLVVVSASEDVSSENAGKPCALTVHHTLSPSCSSGAVAADINALNANGSTT